jgi:Protein  of unknown function (DUF3018)
MVSSSRDWIAPRRVAQRQRGLRAVLLWLPDANDAAYRARLSEECRQLARLTADEAVLADGFAALAAQTPGWR